MKTRLKISAVALAVGALMVPQLAQAQNASQKLFFEGDMVRGSGSTRPSCVLTSQYRQNESVVWRMRVLDQTGQRLDSKGVKSVVVELSDGQKLPMHFGPHPKGKTDDYFWTTSWHIPANYPTGSFSYKIVATGLDGKAHTWSPFNVHLSQLMVIK